MLVRTQTPITSAAKAVPIPKRNSFFPDCDALVPINTFNQDSTALLPLFLELPSQKLFTAFHLSVLLPLSTIFLRLSAPKFAGFAEDVRNGIINLRDKMCDFPFPPRV